MCGDDPSRDWDAHCDAAERAYAARIEGRGCFECANCERPPGELNGAIGWCLPHGDWVQPRDTPADLECGDFE